MTKVKVDRDRIAAEKNGLELILKQKDGELQSMTTDYENLTNRMNELTRERNKYKLKSEEFQMNKATEEFSTARMKTQARVQKTFVFFQKFQKFFCAKKHTFQLIWDTQFHHFF